MRKNVLTSSKSSFGGSVAQTLMTVRYQYPGLLIIVAVICAFGATLTASAAADNEGSLDAIWSESAKSNIADTSNVPNIRANQSAKVPATAGIARPICPISLFSNSEIILTGAWPGVGPFKATAEHPYDFIDTAGDQLHMSITNDQLTAAHMELLGSATIKESLLKLEISTDFLLESLGAKPAKVNEFNLSFEKTTARLKGPLLKQLLLNAGPLIVLIKPVEESPAAEAEKNSVKSKFNVFVNAATGSTNEPLVSESEAEQPDLTARSAVRNNAPATANDDASGSAPSAESSDSQAGPQTLESGTKSGSGQDELKKEFAQVIQKWQGIKKKAVREGQTSALAEVLAGKALTRQTDAIKWLSANHKYCDINPKGTSVERLEEAVPDSKYLVHAVVKEVTRYVDQKSGQLLKEIDDTYHVIYTIEKIDGHWFITDTSIVKVPPKVQR